MLWRIQKCLQVRLSVLIVWQKVDWAPGAPESFSANLMQKHQLFNPHALESRASLLSFDTELKCWRIGTLTPENLHSHANPQMDCNKNNLFGMYRDNKAWEMRKAPFVAHTICTVCQGGCGRWLLWQVSAFRNTGIMATSERPRSGNTV